jgi:long-chain acyl-CoA synthetase
MIDEKNLPEMFVHRFNAFHGKPALKVKRNGAYESISWDELFSIVNTLARGFSDIGIRKDDKVALLAESCPEWIYADMAILSLGAVSVPLFPTYQRREIEYIINHSEARTIIISDTKQWAKIERLYEKQQDFFTVISFEKIDTVLPVIDLSSILTKYSSHDSALRNQFIRRISRINSDDLATIIYTSGTTGPPKGVMLTHGNFLSNVHAAAKAIPVIKGYTALSVLPLSHVFERLVGYYMYLSMGVVIAFAESLQTLQQNFHEIRPHVATMVPRLFEKYYHKIIGSMASQSPLKRAVFHWALNVGKKKYVLELKNERVPIILKLASCIATVLVYNKIKKAFGGRLRFFISGGAKLSREIARFFYAADILIIEGYGLTETSPVVSVNRVDNNKFGSVGLPLDGVMVKLADDGEIMIKGPNVMRGYFKDEIATLNAIKDGWLYTGDIGVIDEQGFLKITDRKKDIIVSSGGKNIAPQNIENMLKTHHFINQAFVCGDGEKFLSALIVPDFEQIVYFAQVHSIHFSSIADLVEEREIINQYKTIIDQINSELPEYEKVKRFTLLSEEFSLDTGELTATLKLKRNSISVHYKEHINKMYRR